MAAPAPAAATGALRGNTPPIFQGDRTKSGDFLLAFRLYKFINRGHEAMINPATRTTTALSYIEGPLVEAWKEEQLTLLELNIANNIAEANEVHWTTFETNFKNAFTNTNKKNDAYRELQVLKHKDDLDTFIAKFKQLTTAAELDIDSHRVIEIFKQGLKNALIQNVLTAPDYDPNATYTFAEMEKRVRDSHLQWINSLSYKKSDQKQRFYANLGIKPRNGGNPFNRGRRTTSQGGDAMDVDTVETTEIDTNTMGFYNKLSEEDKKKLQANNACFYCQKPGHRANDCRKKKYDRAQAGGSGGYNRAQAGGSGGNQRYKAQVKTADLVDLSDQQTTDKTQQILDNLTTDDIIRTMQSEQFMAMDDDEKLKIVAKVAPAGF